MASSNRHIPLTAKLTLLGIVALCTACASVPNTALVEAREFYNQAKMDPQVANNASVALHEAEQSLALASQTKDREEINHLAYVAHRRVDLARAEANTKIAEDSSKRQFKAQEGLRVKSLEDELAALKAKKTERGYVIVLGDVWFDYNKSSLKADAQQNLYPLATFLKDYPERTIAIEGYTDSTGTAAYNLELSKFRAQAVESFLRVNGIQAERMTTQGFGLNNPVASNKTESGRQENRRVEVVISDPNKVSSLKNGL